MRRCLWFASWFASWFALYLCAPVSSGADLARNFADNWSPEDCGVFKLKQEKRSATCGYVSVPLRHGEDASPRIRLAVVIIPATGESPRPEPLFLAQGGPGGSTIGGFAQVLLDDTTKRPAADRDLVLWDQRGTYFSQPRLVCRELSQLSAGSEDALELDAYRRCGTRLRAEAGDLSAFNSLENARDVDSVRAALGYDAFNFYGVSYGTELGQFLLREHPAGLRAVVLDAVVPLGFSLVTDVPAVKQHVMQQYAKSCEESPSCNAAYPSLAKRYLALIDKLNQQPIPLADPVSDRRKVPVDAKAAAAKPQSLTGKDLEGALYQSLYMREAVSLIPYVVLRAEQGDYSFAVNLVTLMQAANSDMADGMYMAVLCSEYGDTPDSALRFPDVLKRLADDAGSEARKILTICRDWKIRLLDKTLLQPVKSAIPTLLLSGRFDPITPPAGADRVAAALAHAYHFTFASGTHGQAFTVPCANQLIRAFLDDPVRAPNGACAREIAPRFVTPDQLLSLSSGAMAADGSVTANLMTLAAPAIAVGLALLVLFSAVPIYAVSETVRIFRRRAVALPDGWQGRLISAAPWIPVLSGFLLLAFLAAAAVGIGGEITRNQMLLLVGAIPVWVRSLTWLLLPYALALALMSLAMVQLWRYRARDIVGRLYYTVLVIAGWTILLVLLRSRVFGF